MSEPHPPFDRQAFETEAKQAFANGVLLDWMSENHFNRANQHYEAICKILVELHNAGEIDLLAPINADGLEGESRDFWFIQNLYCSLIPELESSPDPLIDTVLRLVEKGGDDLAATWPNGAFRDWLTRRPDITKQLLQKAQQSPETKFKLLTFVLEAGAKQNLAEYQAAAIKFLGDEHLENRFAGVTALGRIDTSTNKKCHLKSIASLCKHARTADSDEETAQTVGALLDVYARRPGVEEERVIAAIDSSSKRPTSALHYLLAQSLAFNHGKFSYDLHKAIIDALKSADPSMKGVIDQIDFAFSRCLSDHNREAVANCVQALLDREENPLEFAQLDSFIYQLISKHPETLNWLIVRWLRFGSHRARASLPSLFRRFAEEGYELDLALDECGLSDKELVFISRKALGYFIIEAATAASILIACLRASSSKAAAKTISQLLFDPLMINFSGQARDIVERQAKSKGKRKAYLKDALTAHDDYLAGLKSVGNIPELWPSPSERQVQAERQRQLFARSFKEAEKGSVFAKLVMRQTLLYGVGSVHYMRAPDGKLHRSESLLSSHGTSMEFPRFETIDPVRFQHLILRFRNETLDP